MQMNLENITQVKDASHERPKDNMLYDSVYRKTSIDGKPIRMERGLVISKGLGES
jgi:hypothetical protein